MSSFRISRSVKVAIFSLLAVFLYSRGSLLYRSYTNAPSRLRHIAGIRGITVEYPDVLRNCEDVAIEPSEGFALLSCDPSRDTWNTVMGTFIDPTPSPETGIWIWHYSDKASPPKKLNTLNFEWRDKDFHPLGMHYSIMTGMLFIVNHASAGSSIEVFRLVLEHGAIVHQGSIKHDLLAAPNAITSTNDRELFVTTDHYFLRRYNPILSLLETYLGLPGGSVVHVNLKEPTDPKVEVLANVPFANGIAEFNDSTLAVASSSTNSVYLYRIERPDGAPPREINDNLKTKPAPVTDAATPKLKHFKTIRLPFHPDNLSIDRRGKLLIAGHPHAATLEKIAKDSARCNRPGKDGKEGCQKGVSWIAEWSEQKGLRSLYAGDKFGSSTTAARDTKRGFGIVGGLYERGLMTWTE